MPRNFKLISVSAAIFFIQGCIPLAYTFKEAVPSRIRAQGEAVVYFHLEDPEQVRRLAAEEAQREAVYNLMRKVENMYISPCCRIGRITERNPQAKLEILNLIRQARVRRTRFLKENKIMIELELDGKKLKEVLTSYR